MPFCLVLVRLMLVGLAWATAFGPSRAEGQAFAPRTRPLTVLQIQGLALREGLFSLLAAGEWQEVAWRLADRGRWEEFALLESQMLWAFANERVVDVEPLDLGRAYKLRFESGLTGVYKDDGGRNSSSEEAFAYRFDRALRLRIVPVTDLGSSTTFKRDRHVWSLAHGSIQAYVAGTQPLGVDFRSQPYTDERLYLLDYLLRQIDRSGKNTLLSHHGRLVAIDNSLIEGTRMGNVRIAQIRASLEAPPAWSARPVSAPLLARLKAFVDSDELGEMRASVYSASNQFGIIWRARELIALGPAGASRSCSAYFVTR